MTYFASRLAVVIALSYFLLKNATRDDSRGQPYLKPSGQKYKAYNSKVMARPDRVLRVHGNDELVRKQALMQWSVEDHANGTTVSVIVVESNHHQSNLFRDQARVQAYMSSSAAGNVVTSVQFASPLPPTPLEDESEAPFFLKHPEGVDKRVRIVYAADLGNKKGIHGVNLVRTEVVNRFTSLS